MKYKVGDKVRIKSIDWYNENKDNYGAIYAGNSFGFWKNMSRHCGEIMKITIVKVDPEDSNKGYYFMENCEERWTDEMIEGLVEEETSIDLTVKGEEVKERIEITIPEGYEYVIESGKIIFTKKKKEYPKTYEECCEVLVGRKPNPNEISFGKMELCLVDLDNTQSIDFQNPLLFQLNSLFRLLMCRDAYWKIAGEEMELGKPWEPDWKDGNQKKYCIYNDSGDIQKGGWHFCNAVLAFPTAEMRDAFYENFKEMINQCKELL